MHNNEETSSRVEVAGAIVGYSLCSSTLLLANKAALFYFNRPSAVSVIQIVFATFMVLLMKYVIGVEVDDFEWEKVKPYCIYILAFVSAIYANMRALSVSNVETVIVFRACTPLAVTLIDFLFMGRSFPSLRSVLSLVGVCLCALLYCVTDSEFALKGIGAYYWVSIYFGLIVFEMTYGKKLTANVKMKSVWGPVLYTNTLAIVPMFLLGKTMSNDFEGMRDSVAEIPFPAVTIIMFTCVAGLMIGYFGWLCRSMISATSFTLTGVVNKFITVLLNATLWSKHSSSLGMAAVCGCLIAGAFYEQAPMRSTAAATGTTTTRRTKHRRVKSSTANDESEANREEKENLLELGQQGKQGE